MSGRKSALRMTFFYRAPQFDSAHDLLYPLADHEVPAQRVKDADILTAYQQLKPWEDTKILHDAKTGGAQTD